MKTKQEITRNWLERYTKTPLEKIGRHVLLTNFNNYVDIFCDEMKIARPGYDANMRLASAEGITIINFGMGSPNAALISDLLSAIMPEACLFLGKCGGVEAKIRVGDFLLPVAAVRGEGTSNDYFPPEVPALPHFMLQRVVSTTLKNHCSAYWAGVVYTTNRRVWEHDASFKDYLRNIRVAGVEMECATLFACANYNHLPMGALLLVSDNPMVPEGVKTTDSDKIVNANYAPLHVKLGIEALSMVADGAAERDFLKI
ncbi:MAG: AMP nucleosidase, partial [Bacteroidaceae bacterium]